MSGHIFLDESKERGYIIVKRRKEIARIVTVLPHGQRAALIEALLAFADAAGEPDDAPTTTAASVSW